MQILASVLGVVLFAAWLSALVNAIMLLGHVAPPHTKFGLLFQGCCSRAAVPGLLFQGCCSRAAVPGLLFQGCCSRAAVPGLLFQGCCSRADASTYPDTFTESGRPIHRRFMISIGAFIVGFVIRNERFGSLMQLNRRIRELLDDVNARTMRRYGKSRREIFESLEHVRRRLGARGGREARAVARFPWHVWIEREERQRPDEQEHHEADETAVAELAVSMLDLADGLCDPAGGRGSWCQSLFEAESTRHMASPVWAPFLGDRHSRGALGRDAPERGAVSPSADRRSSPPNCAECTLCKLVPTRPVREGAWRLNFLSPILCCLALIACGGSGSNSDAAIDGPLPDTPGFDSSFDSGVDAMMPTPGRPTFMVERVTGSDQEALIALTQPGDTVDLLALTALELWHMEIGSGSAEVVLTLTDSFSLADPPPSAARAADGTLHVVWESTFSVHYATNASGAWTESELASNGRQVSLALDASGVPHVAFIRLADEVNVARLEGDTWTTEVVGNAPGGIGLPWTAIATEGDRLVLVGTTGVGTFWLRVNDGSGWVDDSIDIGDVVFMGRTGEHTLTAGDGGTLITFQSDRRYAAFRPAGATEFRVATLGNTYELYLDAPVASTVGAVGAFIAGQDFGSRLAVVAPSAPYWPLVAAVPWRGCSRSNIALSMDADEDPIMVAWCEGEITVFRADGNYPSEYEARCDEAVLALCDQACACGGPDGDECGFFIEGRTNSGNRSGCTLAARETLCSDSTEPFETLTSCISMVVAGTCDVNGYPVPEACWPLSRL